MEEYWKDIPKEELTPIERNRLYWSGAEVDHIPYSLIGTEAASILYGIDIRKIYESSDLVIEIEKKLIEDFGIGCMSAGPRLKGIAEALGARMRYPENALYLVEEPLIKDYGMLEQLDIIDPYKDGKLPIMLKMLDRLQKNFGNYDTIKSGVPGPVSLALSLREAGMFLRDLHKAPEQVHRLLSFSMECIMAWVKVVYDEFGCVCSVADPVSSMDLLGKKQFDEFSMPYWKSMVEQIRCYTGKSPSIHVCGKTKKIWKDIAAAGFSGFSADNCEDLEEVKMELGNIMSVSGNVPPVEVLRNGTPEAVIENVGQCIKKAGDSPKGYILSAGCQIPLGTPKENLLAYIYGARVYGKDAVLGKGCRKAPTL